MHCWVFPWGLVGSSVCIPVVSCSCELFVATEPMRLENREGALFVMCGLILIDTVTVSIWISPPALHWGQREEAQLWLLSPVAFKDPGKAGAFGAWEEGCLDSAATSACRPKWYKMAHWLLVRSLITCCDLLLSDFWENSRCKSPDFSF